MGLSNLLVLLTQLARVFQSILFPFLLRKHASAQAQNTPKASDFDVNLKSGTGFFPAKPLSRLPAPFDIWESLRDEASGNLCLGEDSSDRSATLFGHMWRARIQKIPTLPVDILLDNDALCQRAHMVLAFLVQYYAHSMPTSSDRKSVIIPKALTRPLVQISQRLGIAPVLTFADTVLWNWSLIDQSKPVQFDNMQWDSLFSSTGDEQRFYETSARAELHGVEMLRIIESCISGPPAKIADNLNRLTTLIAELSDIIKSVREYVDPNVFYHQVRPWWEGSSSGSAASVQWIYEGYEEESPHMDLSGPSAGQSSLIHALDIWLGIDHAPKRRDGSGFMERMRRYMPGRHRAYLSRLEDMPVRELVYRMPQLRDPYNGAVLALKKLRDQHIKIAVLYVVSMSRTTNKMAGCPVAAMMDKLQTQNITECPRAKATGTGGNELSTLLKAGRDNTFKALI